MSKARVLYIDDEVDLLDLAEGFFLEENVPVDTCSDFFRAVELIKENLYEVIVSDAKMPSGTGMDLFKLLRNQFNFRGKLILVTGDLDNLELLADTGLDVILYKPIAFEELVKTVKSYLV
jgi:DNA-binding response OmpR family regulator